MTSSAKVKIYGGLVKAKSFIDKASVTALGAVSALGTVALTASAEGGTPAAAPVIDVSAVDFSGLTASITSMVPQVLPVAVTVLGIRKAISFMMSTIRGC